MRNEKGKSKSSIFIAGIIAILTTNVFALDRGHQLLIDHGLQLHGMVTQFDNFTLSRYQEANYTAIDWMWDSNVSLHGPAPGAMPWARWVRSPDEMPPTGAEGPYMSKLVALQLGDESDLNNPTIRDFTINWLNSVRSQFPNTLLYVNNYGSQVSDQALADFIQRGKPDLISFDTYPYVQGSQPVGGQPWNWYSDMWRYRAHALGNGIPFGHYRQTFHDNFWRDPSESELRLNTFGALSYGVTYMADFTYNTGNSTFFTTPGGDNFPTPMYDKLKQINKEARNLGKALVKLKPLNGAQDPVTNMMFIRGRHSTGPGTNDVNALPWGFVQDADSNLYSDWVFQRNDPYLSGWGVTYAGTKNDGLKGDVILSWFQPLDESFDGGWTNQIYFMVTNGLSWGDGSAADCMQTIILDFSMGTSGITMLERLDRETGLVTDVPLTLTGGKRRLTLQLDGGTSELYKFKTGAPFVPEPGSTLALAAGGLLFLRRRRSPLR